MPLREFTDGDQRRWQVWDTVPKSAEEDQVFARNAQMLAEAEQRRRAEGGAARVADAAADDARRLSRPLAEAAAAALRRFTEGREHGWLTFMSGDEKRRLSPIPERWNEMDDAALVELLARAERVEQRVPMPGPRAESRSQSRTE